MAKVASVKSLTQNGEKAEGCHTKSNMCMPFLSYTLHAASLEIVEILSVAPVCPKYTKQNKKQNTKKVRDE